MTIEQVEELRKQEMQDELRMPKLQISEDEIEKAFSTQWKIYEIINKGKVLGNLVNRLTFSLIKNEMEVSGKGTSDNPYVIKTEFGEGKVFHIKYIFKDKHCPFQKGNCFSNAFNMAWEMIKLSNVKVCDCVSGISLTKTTGRNRSILHSVVELNNWVIDANLGIVMSKELFYKLFMFEELERINGEQVEFVIKLLAKDSTREISSKYNLRTYHMVFALDDILDFITNKSRQTNHDVFEDLNY